MGNSVIRLLIAAICAVTLVTVPKVTPARATPNDNWQIEKNRKKSQKGLAISDPKPASPSWPPPMYDDFDRKNGGGGGM
jgi:hypothetical protein